MFETEEELSRLQAMLDAHLVRANPHMQAIVAPERRLTARQVATYLQGTKHVAFATVTSKGATSRLVARSSSTNASRAIATPS